METIYSQSNGEVNKTNSIKEQVQDIRVIQLEMLKTIKKIVKESDKSHNAMLDITRSIERQIKYLALGFSVVAILVIISLFIT